MANSVQLFQKSQKDNVIHNRGHKTKNKNEDFGIWKKNWGVNA
jgi:hypothetical protein